MYHRFIILDDIYFGAGEKVVMPIICFGIIGAQQRCFSGMESQVPDSCFVGQQQGE